MPEYNAVDAIKLSDICIKDKIGLLLLFHEEYAGWYQHLKTVGSTWGAAGEEIGAAKEMVKTRKQLDDITDFILKKIEESEG